MYFGARNYLWLSFCLAGCSNVATQREPEKIGCLSQKLELDISGKVTSGSKKELFEAVQSGRKAYVGLHISRADPDTKEISTWFEPVAVTIVNEEILAESPVFYWPASSLFKVANYSEIRPTSFRISTSGKFQSYDLSPSDNPFADLIPNKSENVRSTWCVI